MPVKTKRFSLLTLLLTAVLAVALTAGVLLGAAWLLLGRAGMSMVETMVLINTLFVGEHDNIGEAADQALNSLITGLGDRWSYYMDAESYQQTQVRRSNSYVGIGVTVTYPEEGVLHIEAVAAGGPAEAAGLQAGEDITVVDGRPLTVENVSEATALIQGEEGTQVVLTVRGLDGVEREAAVTRGRVEESPVEGELLSGGTGLVTIRNFNSRCAQDAIAAVDNLLEQGAERLVFDVRNNGGGYVSELTELLDHLLPEGTIFRQRTNFGWETIVDSDAQCVELPMAVLVNGNTYSAAEFFAAQLQEMDWGGIVGEPTFGKGFSQQTFALSSGGAVNLSTARYFTGEGVSLIGAGLTLDREIALTEAQAAALSAGTLDPAEDPQLQAAIELLRTAE